MAASIASGGNASWSMRLAFNFSNAARNRPTDTISPLVFRSSNPASAGHAGHARIGRRSGHLSAKLREQPDGGPLEACCCSGAGRCIPRCSTQTRRASHQSSRGLFPRESLRRTRFTLAAQSLPHQFGHEALEAEAEDGRRAFLGFEAEVCAELVGRGPEALFERVRGLVFFRGGDPVHGFKLR